MYKLKSFTPDFWQTYISGPELQKYLASQPPAIAVNTNFGQFRSGQFTIIAKNSDTIQIVPIAEMDAAISQVDINLRPSCRFKDETRNFAASNYQWLTSNINSLDLFSIYQILLSQNSGWQEYAKYQVLSLIDELIAFNTQLLFNLVSIERELVELTWLYSYLAMNMCFLFPKSYQPAKMIPVDFRDIRSLQDVYHPLKGMKIQRLTELNWSYLDILKKYFDKLI